MNWFSIVIDKKMFRKNRLNETESKKKNYLNKATNWFINNIVEVNIKNFKQVKKNE